MHQISTTNPFFVNREIQRFPYVLFWYFAKFKASLLRMQTVSQFTHGNS